MIRLSFLVLAIIALILPIYPQQIKGEWTPNSWREFTLEETSTKEALKILGKPYYEDIVNLSARSFSTWLSKKAGNQKIFRDLAWEKKASTRSIDMCFLNNKLVFLIVVLKTDLDSDWFSPDRLSKIFGEKFIPFITNGKKFMPSTEFQKFAGERRETLVKKSYTMAAFSEKSFILGYVSDSHEQPLSDEQEAKNSSQTFPGRVVSLTLLSRTLEAN